MNSNKIVQEHVQFGCKTTLLDIVLLNEKNDRYFANALYGVVTLSGAYYIVSRASGTWKAFRQVGGVSICTGRCAGCGSARKVYFTQAAMKQIYESALVAATTTSTTPVLGIVKGVLTEDTVLFNDEAEMSQFVRKGTKVADLYVTIESRKMPKNEHTKLMFINSQRVVDVFKTEVVTETKFIL